MSFLLCLCLYNLYNTLCSSYVVLVHSYRFFFFFFINPGARVCVLLSSRESRAERLFRLRSERGLELQRWSSESCGSVGVPESEWDKLFQNCSCEMQFRFYLRSINLSAMKFVLLVATGATALQIGAPASRIARADRVQMLAKLDEASEKLPFVMLEAGGASAKIYPCALLDACARG